MRDATGDRAPGGPVILIEQKPGRVDTGRPGPASSSSGAPTRTTVAGGATLRASRPALGRGTCGALFLVAVMASAALAPGCRTEALRPHPELGPLWREYQALPTDRALAIAGHPRSGWVAGMAGGHATRAQAVENALDACEQRRLERRLRVDCTLYAVDDEIVWRGR